MSMQGLVDIAMKEVGVHEVPGHNNVGPRIEEYQRATWLAPGPWPWCAAFVAWCLYRWLQDPAVQESLLLNKASLEDWRCRDASAFGWIKWAQQKHLQIVSPNNRARAGDIVVYEFSHCGIVKLNQVPSTNGILTIEGNTNDKGARDSTEGDGVWTKVRKTSLVRCYVRIEPVSDIEVSR